DHAAATPVRMFPATPTRSTRVCPGESLTTDGSTGERSESTALSAPPMLPPNVMSHDTSVMTVNHLPLQSGQEPLLPPVRVVNANGSVLVHYSLMTTLPTRRPSCQHDPRIDYGCAGISESHSAAF